MINMHAFVQMPQCETRYGRIDPDAKWTFRIPYVTNKFFSPQPILIFFLILSLGPCCDREDKKEEDKTK